MITEKITEIIIRYLDGSASEQECSQLVSWLEDSEENKRFFANLSAEYASHKGLTMGVGNADMNTALARINSRIDADEVHASNLRNRVLRTIPWAVAAASVLVCFFAFHSFTPGVKESAVADSVELICSYMNNTASVAQVSLDDQTSVYLSSGARIRYNVAGPQRLVKLDGEAYFDVAKDSLRPFTVDIGNIKVRVLGTAFSARSGSEFSNSEVVLERGSVRLLSESGVNLVSMKPNQKAVFNQSTEDITIEDVYAFSYVMEKYNLVSLSYADIYQIVSAVEKTYSVHIKFNASHPEGRYDFNFVRSDSLGDVIRLVEVLTGEELTVIR